MAVCKRLLTGLAAFACLLALGGSSIAQSGSFTRIFQLPYLHLATENGRKWSPAVAYSPLHNVYLAVWEMVWPNSHHDIYARLVSAAGQQGPEFVVYSGDYDSKQPAVAYDPTLDRFLVVWSYDYSGDSSDYDIYARFIPWNGPSPSFEAFAMDNGRDSATKPRLAYGSIPNKFLIVWKVEENPPFIAGGLYTPPLTLKSLLISTGPEVRDFPDVTYNLYENEFVVAWDEDVGRGSQDLDIYAIRLDANGDPKGSGEFAVTSSTSDEQHPTVAACYWSDEVLFAWQQEINEGPDENIYGRILPGFGALEPIYGLEGTTLPQRYPRLSCSPDGTEYLLVWHDQYAQPLYRWGVWAALIHTGLIVEPAFEVVRPSDDRDRLYPAVALGKQKALVVWQHARDDTGDLDIWGQVIWFNPFTTYVPIVRK